MDAVSKQKQLKKTLEALAQSVVVVEGVHDQKALAKAGVKAETVAVGANRLEDAIKKIGAKALGKRVVLLTDFDAEGKRKEKELREALHSHGVRVDAITRRKVKRLFPISTIEQLPYALEKLEEELAGSSQ